MDETSSRGCRGEQQEDDRRLYMRLLAEACSTNEDDLLLYHLVHHQGLDVYAQRLSHFDRLVQAERIRQGIDEASEALLLAKRAYRANPRDAAFDRIIQSEGVRRGCEPPIEYLATFFLADEVPRTGSPGGRVGRGQQGAWRG